MRHLSKDGCLLLEVVMSVYEIITDRILQKLSEGVIPWRKPWNNAGLPKNFVSKKEYRGINLFLLNMMPYESPYFLTFKQVKDLGGVVNAGVKSMPVVFYTSLEVDDVDEKTGEITKKDIPVLRYYNVFNVEQTNITVEPITHTTNEFNAIERCEEVVKNMPNPPAIQHGKDAKYITLQDSVYIPSPERFNPAEEYYCSLFHELVHSTGHEKRLNRKSIAEKNGFGTKDYGYEELIAEMGASFLCGITGIERKTLDNNAAYIDGWMKVIKADKRLLINAASQAQKAVDYITARKDG